MGIGETSAGSAVALQAAQNRFNFQTESIRSGAERESSVASLVAESSGGSAGGGTTTPTRGNLLNITV